MVQKLLAFAALLFSVSVLQGQQLSRPAGPLGIQPTAVSIREALDMELEGPVGANHQCFSQNTSRQYGAQARRYYPIH